MNSCGLGDETTAMIVMQVKQARYLQTLNLRDNDLGWEVCAAFGEVLRFGTLDLKYLDLSHNRFIDRNMKVFCQGLTKNLSLISINLQKNDITN